MLENSQAGPRKAMIACVSGGDSCVGAMGTGQKVSSPLICSILYNLVIFFKKKLYCELLQIPQKTRGEH